MVRILLLTASTIDLKTKEEEVMRVSPSISRLKAIFSIVYST
jgi:hypothetical protein